MGYQIQSGLRVSLGFEPDSFLAFSCVFFLFVFDAFDILRSTGQLFYGVPFKLKSFILAR